VLPPELSSLPQRTAHGVIVTLLVALNALYVAAEVYHQIALKDGLLHRMWFGNGSA
jgi:cytochrome b561